MAKKPPPENPEDNLHWAEAIAEEVIGEFPNEKEYVCAAGISPSGVVHFGNFRDVMTIVAVGAALRRRGKQVRLLFSWDDYDRFRKVPAGIDPTFEEHIGKPLSALPDPHGDSKTTYASRFERIFEAAMKELDITLDYRYQTELYRSGTYDDAIREALTQREKIGKVLFDLMSDKSKKANNLTEADFLRDYYPVAIYSEFTGKDFTKITGLDGDTLTYECKETGQTGTVTIGKDRNLKLGWKPDWAMRWRHEGVAFEPGGVDHLSPGGPYEASSRIIREVFKRVPPVTARYGMVGLQGVAGKMSGSTGLAKSPNELLEVYTEPILRWLYLRTMPKKNFSLTFDTEIFRQYDEFDRDVQLRQEGELPRARAFAIEESFKSEEDLRAFNKNPVSFRQLVSFGQIVQWDEEKVFELLRSSGTPFTEKSVKLRLPRARNWLVDHNPDQLIELLDAPNKEYFEKMPENSKKNISKLAKALSAKGGESIPELEELVYSIPKDPKAPEQENKKAQRAFFKDVYQLLIGQDTGPRLGTFLWAVERGKVRRLLMNPQVGYITVEAAALIDLCLSRFHATDNQLKLVLDGNVPATDFKRIFSRLDFNDPRNLQHRFDLKKQAFLDSWSELFAMGCVTTYLNQATKHHWKVGIGIEKEFLKPKDREKFLGDGVLVSDEFNSRQVFQETKAQNFRGDSKGRLIQNEVIDRLIGKLKKHKKEGDEGDKALIVSVFSDRETGNHLSVDEIYSKTIGRPEWSSVFDEVFCVVGENDLESALVIRVVNPAALPNKQAIHKLAKRIKFKPRQRKQSKM